MPEVANWKQFQRRLVDKISNLDLRVRIWLNITVMRQYEKGKFNCIVNPLIVPNLRHKYAF